MKVLLVNAPAVKYKNDFKNIEAKIFFNNLGDKIKKIFGKKLYKMLPIPYKKGFKYGNRAGCRWPIFHEYKHTDWNFPFVMALTTSYLRKNGIEADMMDCIANYEYSYKKFLKKVKDYKADIVIMETSTTTLSVDLYLAKEISKHTEVALAGAHLTSEAEYLQKEHPYISYFLKGEYIKSALKIAQTRKKGIYEIDLIENFDDLPFLARDFEGCQNIYDPSMPTQKPQLIMYGSKGCPFNCSYCMWPSDMYNKKCSLRSPKLIAQEIKENVEKYGYKSILFDDDTFNIGNDRISELCDYLKEIGLPWTMMGRLDCSPDWLFDKMVESGCVGMRFGVETFNVDVLKNINKGLERIDFLGTIKHLSEKYPDLYLRIFMMKDLPGQSDEMHKKDIEILENMGFSHDNMKRSIQISTCVPFPGTELYKKMKEKYGSEIMRDWNKYNGVQDTIMTEINKSKITS